MKKGKLGKSEINSEVPTEVATAVLIPPEPSNAEPVVKTKKVKSKSSISERIAPESIPTEAILAKPGFILPENVKPASAEVVIDEPAPVIEKLIEAVVDKPVIPEPVVTQPIVNEPVVIEPIAPEPAIAKTIEPVPLLIEPEPVVEKPKKSKVSGIVIEEPLSFQKLEEKAAKAQEALEKEEKLRKDLEALNSKLLAEKTALLDSLSGEKGALQDYQEKCAKLTAQKNDLDNQLRVSIYNYFLFKIEHICC